MRRSRRRILLWVILAALGLFALLILAGGLARARAEKIQCANVLSSLELAASTYAIDCNGAFAPNLQCMSNDISTTRILDLSE